MVLTSSCRRLSLMSNVLFSVFFLAIKLSLGRLPFKLLFFTVFILTAVSWFSRTDCWIKTVKRSYERDVHMLTALQQ
jgi:uncharacterized membrane protein YGL010W